VLAVLLLLPFVLRVAYPNLLTFLGEDDTDRPNPPFEVTLVQGTTEPDEQSGGSGQKELTSIDESASDVVIAVVRVSGTPGAAYAGSYGITNRMEYTESILGTEPAYYVAAVRRSSGDSVEARFEKLSLGPETLKAEILVDNEVVEQDETSSDFGTVEVTWKPGASSR
jgi:hypothetical protein